MKIQICIAALIAICVTPAAKADHKHGGGNECWRDSKYPGSGWAYYYCGAQSARCDGKKSKGHDTVFWQSHGEGFTFQTEPHETYFCCGGNGEKSGMYVRSDTWIVNTETERMSVAGGTCNKQIKTCCGMHRTGYLQYGIDTAQQRMHKAMQCGRGICRRSLKHMHQVRKNCLPGPRRGPKQLYPVRPVHRIF